MEKKNLKLQLLVAIAVGAVLNPLKVQTAEAATIKADSNVNIRAAASATSKKIGALTTGKTTDLIGYENGWFKISWNGQIGYTSMNYWSGNTATTTAKVNVRQAADAFAPIIGQVAAGAEVIVLGRSESWLYIDYHGISGFSHRKFWEVPDSFFDHLPYIDGEMTEESLTFFREANPGPVVVSAGDQYRIISEIQAYKLTADALSGKDPVMVLPSGTYYIHKVINGCYNVSTDPQTPGLWIDPTVNIGRIAPPPIDIPEPQVSPDPIEQPWKAGDSIKLQLNLAGYKSSADAVTKTKPSGKVTAGEYFVFKIDNGMVNVSTSATKSGTWINPTENTLPVQPPIVTPPVQSLPGKTPPPQTPPALEAGHSVIGDRVVEEARKLLGAPYIYGAESWAEGGFDCSGLTQYVYSQLHIDIPRTASYQWAGIKRKVTVPRPGDLIAFAKVEEGGVYHIGVYIGNNQMIHAPKPGDVVKISSLDWYYRNGWVQGFLRPYAD